jgi:multidrug efflux system membrane fusion protein
MKSQKSKVESRKSKVGRDVFAFVLLLGIALIGASCSKKSSAAEVPAVAVKVAQVEATTLSHSTRYSASIKPDAQVELAFNVSGYLMQLHQVSGVDGKLRDVQEGDVIPAGTVLARIRHNDYAAKVSQVDAQTAEAKSALEASQSQLAEAKSAIASGQSQLAEVEAACEKARLDFERAKNLFTSQSFTKPEFDAVQMQFDTMRAKRDAARLQIAMLEAKAQAADANIAISRARVEGAQARGIEARIPLHDTALRAPMNAVVLQKFVEVGTLVAPGKPGFVLADTSSVKAIFGVPDATLASLKLGSSLNVTTEALPGAEFRGQITRIAPAADAQSRVFEVAVTIPNLRQQFKVGMIASLEITASASREQVLIVPVSAIVRAKDKPDQYAVFVVAEQSGKAIARARTIKPGAALGNTIVVLAGVQPGERVITAGATLVLDGQAVQVIP